jgi:hypothetical protein
MILLFKKGSKFTGPSKSGEKSSIFPLINLPVYNEGEKVELNDFQWWSYTDKWNEWLEKNPRSWTAESEEIGEDLQKLAEEIFKGEDPYRKFFNFQAEKIISEGRMPSFSEFSKIYEQEGEEVQSTSEGRKNTKLVLAIDKMAKQGTFKKEMLIDELEIGKDYAVVVDFISEDGEPAPLSRQALKFRKFRETDKFALGYVNYSIPFGKLPEDPENFLEKIGEYTLNALKGAGIAAALYASVYVAGQAFLVWSLYKGSKNIYKNWNTVRKINQTLGRGNFWTKMKNFGLSAFKGRGTSSIVNAARINLPTGSSIVGTQAFGKSGQLLNLPQTKFVARGAVKRGLISKAASRKLIQAAATRGATTAAARGATTAATAAVAGSNPIGWIITAAYAAASGIQQTINWVSKKQAPRYSEVKSFASGKFSPGKVKTGNPITVCWTEDGGAGTWGGIAKALTLSKDDTRTTMDLVKLGNFKGKSVFMLMNVNSKSMDEVLKNNDIVLLVFENSKEFSRGAIDNDDLVFETIAIEDSEELAIATYFIGYSDWEDMSSEYKEAPDRSYFVPENAPEKYSFHMSGINVQGDLMDSNELEGAIADLLPIPGKTVSVSESLFLESETSESIPFAMNFGSFVNSVSEEEEEQIKFGPIDKEEEEKEGEDKKPPVEKKKEKEDNKQEEEKETSWEKEFSEINKGKNVSYDNPYSQIPLAVYEVEDIEFVDPKEKGQLPKFKYFIVALESLEAKKDEPIGVEVTSEDPVIEPRFGLAKFSPKEEEEKEPEEKPGEESGEEREEKTKKTTHKDISITSGATKTTIRDKEVDGGINIYDEFLTDEDKKKLALPNWKNVTYAQIRKNRDGEPQVVVLKNKFAKLGDRVRKIRKGQSGFDNAVDFIERIKSKVKYV